MCHIARGVTFDPFKGELRKVHTSFVIELLEEKWKKETLEALEQMADVVK